MRSLHKPCHSGYTLHTPVATGTDLDIRMVADRPQTCGGDWFRQGVFETGSRPWSPRHVKQGYRQMN